VKRIWKCTHMCYLVNKCIRRTWNYVKSSYICDFLCFSLNKESTRNTKKHLRNLTRVDRGLISEKWKDLCENVNRRHKSELLTVVIHWYCRAGMHRWDVGANTIDLIVKPHVVVLLVRPILTSNLPKYFKYILNLHCAYLRSSKIFWKHRFTKREND
jgi:hypothetical protein